MPGSEQAQHKRQQRGNYDQQGEADPDAFAFYATETDHAADQHHGSNTDGEDDDFIACIRFGKHDTSVASHGKFFIYHAENGSSRES